jgi:putative methionine-R-sulfoxide reductase with GAF domain
MSARLELAQFPPDSEDLGSGPSALTLEGFLRDLLEARPAWIERGVRAEILFFNPHLSTLEQIAQVNFTGTRETMRVRRVRPGGFEGEGICVYAARQRETVLVPQVAFDKRYRPVQEQDRTQSELAVPLELGSRLVGVLNLEADVPRAFGNGDVEHLERTAPLAALLIDYETYRFEEEFVGRVSARLSSLVEEEEILAEVLQAAIELTGPGTIGGVLVPDREDQPKWLRVILNRGLDLLPDEGRDLESFGVIRRALRASSGQCYWSREDGLDDYVDLAEGIQCEFVTVMRAGGRVIAVIDVESARPALSERYRRAIRRCADHAAALVEALRRKGGEERNKVLKHALRGVEYEAHSALGIFGLLVESLNQETKLSGEPQLFLGGIGERLADSEALIRAFQDPPRSVNLREVLEKVGRRAVQLGMRLELRGDLDLSVWGNPSGFIWLFENLISNSRRHARVESEVRAFLHVDSEDGRGRVLYWDNGRDPAAVERFLDGRSSRRGFKHIQALCDLYKWKVEPRRGEDDQLVFEFTFSLLDQAGRAA